MKKLTYYRNSNMHWLGKTRDVLIIENLVDTAMLFQIHINGYLLDFVYMFPLEVKRYYLRGISQTVEITVADVEEEVDLRLPENQYLRNWEFFQNMK